MCVHLPAGFPFDPLNEANQPTQRPLRHIYQLFRQFYHINPKSCSRTAEEYRANKFQKNQRLMLCRLKVV